MFERVPRQTLYHGAEAGLLVVAAFTGAGLLAFTINPQMSNSFLLLVIGVVFTASLIVLIRLWMNPDRVRATQTDAILNLASETSSALSDGLDETAAQSICETLLPATSAVAVAITDKQIILGYAGVDKDLNPTDAPIRTAATHAVLEDGQMRVMYSAEEIGFPENRHTINAGIVVPLKVSDQVVGTLKFYFPKARFISETQKSVASGFGELISTQMAATAMEEQKKLATSMELKALQSQINPHFLFNTINTIASFIRTDPAKARVLLREFATFYRRTLEDASDLITLAREVDQTTRYLGFEIARFGEDRLQLENDIPADLAEIPVPAFMVQPLVENAVKHAMPAVGCLHIKITAERKDDDLVIKVIDDGVGMSEDRRQNIMNPSSHTGLGIAVRNIRDRIKGYFGPESYMAVESEEGKGTTVILYLGDACSLNRKSAEGEAEAQAE